MNRNLAEYIRRYIEIDDDELAIFNSFLKERDVDKKQYLFRSASVCKSKYFILEGCFRLFYVDKKGNEQIMHFGIENWWITDYDSLLNKTPSELNLQAIEGSKVLELNGIDLEDLYDQLPKAERLFRIIAQKTYIASQRRLQFMFSLSGEEMYEKFRDFNPAFTQRVPQYMLASYLGFTPEFLSKIRGKKS
ncbi:Crp/Fnr family transcriptional regulator [Fulvivirgaceae bacterium BMA10]|uniref:Crp/Fnr family transcriptional regulator n=1 Tax=Splendidivirga corallicola TaxID=3051826 RepID=A0ABT8KHS2_9BACT|nr:Crp/Fnr family transcriptional regulator [Fulvivirgaceae bacterium BMA10]